MGPKWADDPSLKTLAKMYTKYLFSNFRIGNKNTISNGIISRRSFIWFEHVTSYCSLFFLSQVQFVQPITTRHSMFLQSLLSAYFFVHLIFRVYVNIYYFFHGLSEIREWPYRSYTLTSIQLTPIELAIGGFCISRLVSALFTKNRTTLRTT